MVRYIPGQEKKLFFLYRKKPAIDSKGRVSYSGTPEKIGSFSAMISNASQREQEQWKQMGHPITHTISMRGTSGTQAEDTIQYGSRKFYVQGVVNPGEVGIYEIIYCEERMGVTQNADSAAGTIEQHSSSGS